MPIVDDLLPACTVRIDVRDTQAGTGLFVGRGMIENSQTAQRLGSLRIPAGLQIRDSDVMNYTAGVNQYIAEARLDPSKMPAEYAAIGRPHGPDDWKPTDVVAELRPGSHALFDGVYVCTAFSELLY